MSSNFPYVRRLLKALADKMPVVNSVVRVRGMDDPTSISTVLTSTDTVTTSAGANTSGSGSSSSSSVIVSQQSPPPSSSQQPSQLSASTIEFNKQVSEANNQVELGLSGQETAMVMHGLRSMGSEWAQVR